MNKTGGIRKKLKSPRIKEIFVCTGVELAYLHGSVAQRRALPYSDIDIALLLPSETSRIEAIKFRRKLFCELEEIIRSDRIHLSLLNYASPLFCYKAISHGIILYQRNEVVRSRFEGATYSLYFFSVPFYKFFENNTERIFRNGGFGNPVFAAVK